MSTDFNFLDEAKPVTQETLDATLQEVADLEAQLKALKKKKGITFKLTMESLFHMQPGSF